MKRARPSLLRSPATWLVLGLATVTGAAAVAACGGDDAVTASTGTSQSTSGSGGSSTTSTTATTGTTGSGGAGGGSTTATTSAGTGGSGGASTTTTSGAGGSGGAGGAGGAWPTCDAQPAGVPKQKLNDVWTANPSQPTEVWLPGVFVTAISQGGCVAGSPCQIFVQQKETFPNLAAGAQQALKLFISKSASQYFTTVKVDDQVDVLAWGVREPTYGELILEVNLQYKGCAKTVGTGTTAPVTATLDDLTMDAYKNTLGPLFVELDGVSGKPQTPTEIFALWKTGVFSDAGVDAVVNLSPYFLSGGAFSGLTQGKITDFTSIRGVFGVVPEGMPAVEYKVVYPRKMADVVVGQVHP